MPETQTLELEPTTIIAATDTAPDIAASLGPRMRRLALFAPITGLKHHDDPYGKIECAFLLMNAVLEAMEQADQGLSRDEMIARVEPYLERRDALRGEKSDFESRRAYLDRLIDALRSGGEPFNMPYFDYARLQPEAGESFRLISVEEVAEQGRYALTAEGLALLYRLYEVDDVLQVEMDLLLIHRQIQKGQYDRALSSIDRLDHACRTAAARFIELRRRILHGVERISPADIQHSHRMTQEQLNGEAELFEEIHSMVQHKEEETLRLSEHSPAERKAVLQLARIRQRLSRSQHLHTRLASENLAIRDLYEDMLRRAITLDEHYARLKPMDDLFLRFVQGYGDADELMGLLLPLRRRRLFHIADWLAERRIASEAGREELLDELDELPPETEGRLESLRRAAAHLAEILMQAGGRLTSAAVAARLADEDDADTAHYLLVMLLLHNHGPFRLDSPLLSADVVLSAFGELGLAHGYERFAVRGTGDRHALGGHTMTGIEMMFEGDGQE